MFKSTVPSCSPFKMSKLRQISTKDKHLKLTWPKVFNLLKDCGVETFETKLWTYQYQTTFLGSDDKWVHTVPTYLDMNKEFKPLEIKKIVAKKNKEDLHLQKFLEKVTVSGGVLLSGDVIKRTLTFGGKEGETLEETIPV